MHLGKRKIKDVIDSLKNALSLQKSYNGDKDKELDELKDQLYREKTSGADLREKISKLAEEVKDNEDAKKHFLVNIDDLKSSLDESNNNLTEEIGNNDKLQKEISDLEKKEKSMIRNIAAVLKDQVNTCSYISVMKL